MQKALSLYIDNGMFARNTQHLHHIYHAQWNKIKDCLEKYALNILYRISKGSVTFQLSKGILSPSIQHMFGKCYYFSGQKADFLQIFFEQDFADKLEQFVRYLNE